MKCQKIVPIIVGLALFCFSRNSSAQIVSATIGVNGLTCSQCSRSVEMELKKLPFVAKVDMDLEHTQGEIFFKRNENINLDDLSQAIRNAGFSTRFVKVQFDFSVLNLGSSCFIYNDNAFYFLKPLEENHPERMQFQVLAPGFLPKKELKNYSFKTSGTCAGAEKYYLKALGG